LCVTLNRLRVLSSTRDSGSDSETTRLGVKKFDLFSQCAFFEGVSVIVFKVSDNPSVNPLKVFQVRKVNRDLASLSAHVHTHPGGEMSGQQLLKL
jgi:hypothetical protein